MITALRSQVLNWKQAHYHGTAGRGALYFERPPDDPGAVVHQMTPHAPVVSWVVNDSDPSSVIVSAPC